MPSLQLPPGNRLLDLVGEKDGVYTFGHPEGGRAISDHMLKLRNMIGCFGSLSFAVAVTGAVTTRLFLLAGFLMLLLIGLVVVSLLDLKRNRLADETVRIDARRGVVILPGTQAISGEFPMADLELRIEDEKDAGRNSTRISWVVIAGRLEDREARLEFSVRLYGPGHRGDMMTAAHAIHRLGDWGAPLPFV